MSHSRSSASARQSALAIVEQAVQEALVAPAREHRSEIRQEGRVHARETHVYAAWTRALSERYAEYRELSRA